jgi:hypothetical protein
MMMVDPVDMIGDTLHAGIHIFPHVLCHTVYKRCNSAATTQAAVRALERIGFPGREVKVQIGKGKNPTKADLPSLNGYEVRKVVEGRGAELDAVLSPSDPCAAKAYKVWEAYDCMSAAWSPDPGDDQADRHVAAQVLRAAAEGLFSAFLDVATVADVTPYVHFVVWHFPTCLEAHGCIDCYNEQCMEHANREVKQGYRQGSNHQRQRVTCTGKLTLSRTGQVLKRSTLMAHHRDMHGPAHRAQPHMPKRKVDEVMLELEEQAAKRKN